MATVRVVESVVSVGPRELAVLRPEDSEALLDEAAFARDEFLPYWAELWPSGVALARVVAARQLEGARVLELGCGLALPSIAAASAGADALATDWSADAVALASWNARRNGVRIATAVVDWDRPASLLAAAPWELVLAADVLYERRNGEILGELLPRLTDTVLLADPGRPWAGPFLEHAAAAWDVEPVAEGVLELERRSAR
jgi:predicted nicotinamide N-methyase